MGYGYDEEAADDVEIDCEMRVATTKAMLIYDGKKEVWIPKSQIKDKKVVGGVIKQITIGNWLAKDKGLV